ncbi:hypothetical protein ACFY4I_27895 [Streptomyces scabiei]|uniref:hypothetical protein n=1 Tax=Streptomyces scabiei TaxID=1930 RepID=UPI00369EBC85
MSPEAGAVLGAFYFVAFLALVAGGAVLIFTKVVPRLMARERRQKIETAMRLGMFDQEVIEGVADQLRRERVGES